MTSNAKIGLLLGLAIIFLIVFVINGLSGFDIAKDNSPSPTLVKELPGINPPSVRQIKPDITPVVFVSRRVSERRLEEPPPVEVKEPLQNQAPDTKYLPETADRAEPVEQAWPKVYIVCRGDNLADIAKKFYGPEEGNRRVNVQRIFQANSKSLESADMIYPGQKLIIPSLRALVNDKNGMESIFPESMFEKVESIGRRHL